MTGPSEAKRPHLGVASNRRDMKDLPKAVQRTFGLALFSMQCGERPPNAKLLKGFGGTGVLELLEDDRSGAYRTVYTVRFWSAIYVLHVFQKKSKSGIATPRQEIDRVMERLKQAEAIHRERTKERKP